MTEQGTQSPLERAARAIDKHLGIDDMLDCTPVELARAVLMAVREPSEAMVNRGGDVPCDDYVSGGVIYSAPAETKAIYQAMIDAALGE